VRWGYIDTKLKPTVRFASGRFRQPETEKSTFPITVKPTSRPAWDYVITGRPLPQCWVSRTVPFDSL
jgi:hypothetical protein